MVGFSFSLYTPTLVADLERSKRCALLGPTLFSSPWRAFECGRPPALGDFLVDLQEAYRPIATNVEGVNIHGLKVKKF